MPFLAAWVAERKKPVSRGTALSSHVRVLRVGPPLRQSHLGIRTRTADKYHQERVCQKIFSYEIPSVGGLYRKNRATLRKLYRRSSVIVGLASRVKKS